MPDTYDLIIIGSGPAGLSAAIYAKRAELKVLVFEDPYSLGSQITQTYDVDNYIGFHNIDGQTLYDTFRKHAESLNIEFKKEKVIDIVDYSSPIKIIKSKSGDIKTKNIILATGASPKKLGCVGEDTFIGAGVSYCATCDGAFFKDKVVAVVGGGDVAAEDAIFLSRIARKVYVIVRKDYMRATKTLVTELENKSNVEILYNSKINEIYGEGIVGGILVANTAKESLEPINYLVDGVFIAVGINPASDLYKDKCALDPSGFVVASEDCLTNVPGLLAIGDVRTKKLRQVITACSDGANAITSITSKW